MKRKHKIFVVDDDSGFRKTLSDILRLKGYDTVALDTGQAALDHVQAETPVVALIDLRLGDMSGLSLMETIKSRHPGTACIVLTGHADQGSAIQALNLGAYGYMQKPYDIEQLLVMIRRAVEMWDAEASLREYAERLKNLHLIDQAILEARSPQAIADAALQGLQQLVPCQRGSIITFDFEQDEALILATYSAKTTELKTNGRFPLTNFSITDTFCQGEVRTVADIEALPNPTETDQLLLKEGLHAYMSVPLLSQNGLIGMLGLASYTAGQFSPEHTEIAQEVAAQLTVAIQQAHLNEQIQLDAIELEQHVQDLQIAQAALEEERASLARRVAERTRELQVANAELARSGRLKDEFLASMSHELRTPLNAVLGLSEALQEEVYGPLNGKQHDSLKTIEESGRHLLALINDILDVSKIEAGKLVLETASVSAEMVSHASLSLVKQAAHKKRVRLSSSFNNVDTTLQADQRRLKQILVNLLSNAVKFTPEGGEVGLEVVGDLENEVIRFTVWDTGIGISEKGMKDLFEPFIQLDSSLAREHMGTGLGLTLVQRLTEMHNGGISVESEVGKGSRFTVSLPWQGEVKPLTIIGEKDNLPTISVSSPPSSNNHHSNPPKKNQLFTHLDDMGFDVIAHSEGMGAFEQILTHMPDVVILDTSLPDMSGWEVLAQLKLDPQTQDIPVLMVSLINDHTSGLTWGAAGHLVKPISRRQVEEALSRVLPYEAGFSAKIVVIMSEHEKARQIATSYQEQPLILLAEDNENNVNTISNYLLAKGYRIVTAWNGREAITEAREVTPDLILMDIQMPVMDGLEATRRLRADPSTHTIPIIALTALAMSGDRERCLQAGANEYLSKPISLSLLVKTIQLHLEPEETKFP